MLTTCTLQEKFTLLLFFYYYFILFYIFYTLECKDPDGYKQS